MADEMLLVQGMRWPDPYRARQLAEKAAHGDRLTDAETAFTVACAEAYDRLVHLRGDACWWAHQILAVADAAP